VTRPNDVVLARAFVILSAATRKVTKGRPELWAALHDAVTQVQRDCELVCRQNGLEAGDTFLRAVECVRDVCKPNFLAGIGGSDQEGGSE